MARRRRRESYDDESDGVRLVMSIVFLVVGYFVFVHITNKERFWYEITHYLLPAVFVAIGLFALYLFYLTHRQKGRHEFTENRLKFINESGLEPMIIVFIDRFGKEGKSKGWKYRNNSFDWTRLKDFREELINKNVPISVDDYKDFCGILRHFIDKREKEYLAAGTDVANKETHTFSELNRAGSDLEQLIVRLYDAMGYVSKRIGGAGDQGADVIASKNGENVLIQAKSYTKTAINNGAVQQAHTALAFHGCGRAVVVTTTTFTDGAVELARANNVELVDGELLKRKLQEHLGEIWV